MKRLDNSLFTDALKTTLAPKEPSPNPIRSTKAADYFRNLNPPSSLTDQPPEPPPPSNPLSTTTKRKPHRSSTANHRTDRTLPARLAMVEPSDARAGNLFSPAHHTADDGQIVLPGFASDITMPTPALPLALYDLGLGNAIDQRGRGAPLALRLWIEAVLSVPLEDRLYNQPVAMEVPLRDLLARLYPSTRRPRPNEYWPRLEAAVEALESPQARIPFQDPTSGESGLQRVVLVSRIPRGPGALDDKIRFIVDLPPGAHDGPVVSPNLAQWGVQAAAPYRALIGLAYRWWHPGVTRYPVRRGQHWLQRQDPNAYGNPLTDAEAIALCFPTSSNKQKRFLAFEARRVLKTLVEAGEARIVEGRLLPPKQE